MQNRFNKSVISTLIVMLICALLGQAHAGLDGYVFDQGAVMSTRSPGADAALDQLAFYRGSWHVEYKSFAADGRAKLAYAIADVSYVNRGHGLIERLHSDQIEGHTLDTVTMIAYNPGAGYWTMGIVDSFKENIAMFNGYFHRNRLVLHDAVRTGGGVLLTHYRASFDHPDEPGFSFKLEQSTDDQQSWQTLLTKTYTPADSPHGFFKNRKGLGKAASDMPGEARQFDFLLGQWDAAHAITMPNGQLVQFPVNSTAVFTMSGHAVMEHSWYDVDPNLPDAATTIIRIYNRAMRRWESLYLSNRGNGMLYFGGRQEGDRIVLHNFANNSANRSIPFYVFYDIKQDHYLWYAESSSDRGKTYNKTWTIEMSRKTDS